MRVKIFGAGSIGNHLAHGLRRRDAEVTICDVDPAALERTRNEIYPERYGAFDPAIRLLPVADVADEAFDLVVIGTPPDSHLAIAREQLERAAPRVMVIEKPLCTPDLAGAAELRDAAAAAGTAVCVGYNHTLTAHTRLAEQWLAEQPLGSVTTLVAGFREHWGGIFGAHPWLSGPKDTYLGYTERGGGALGEHSHAINIWQHFARVAGLGPIVEVQAMLDSVEEDGARYDRIAQLSVRSESGIVGQIVQDVVTKPSRKWVRLQGSEGFLEWEVNVADGEDGVRMQSADGETREERVQKTRPDDFQPEVDHLIALVERGSPDPDSPIALERGLDTMLVIAAALRSSAEGRSVRIDPRGGYGTGALS